MRKEELFKIKISFFMDEKSCFRRGVWYKLTALCTHKLSAHMSGALITGELEGARFICDD